MIDVYVNNCLSGNLFASVTEKSKHYFQYKPDIHGRLPEPQKAISLTMPVIREPYEHRFMLHPIFDMNLPEGALADNLTKRFSKLIPNFNRLELLKIVGGSQIGRLRFASIGEKLADMPSQNIKDILLNDGAEGLFESLMEIYAPYSGISGAQPKILVRDDRQNSIDKIIHKGATHIIKAWGDDYPQLAANEYFCMKAAQYAGIKVPNFELSSNGKFLVVERFDLSNESYMGFEDFCVLNGKSSERKYDGSYEMVARRIIDFVSPCNTQSALEQFFKIFVLSCVVKNGDAHLKNFGVLYLDAESDVNLSPAFDIVSTTPYITKDILALMLNGTKRWPKQNALLGFANKHCQLSIDKAKTTMTEVAIGVLQAKIELQDYIAEHADMTIVGNKMLQAWQEGLLLSIPSCITLLSEEETNGPR